MKFLKAFCLVIGLSLKISCVISGSKVDLSGARSTWHIPSTVKTVLHSDPGDSYYNYNTISNGQLASSFTPTTSLGPQPSLTYQPYNGYQIKNQVDATSGNPLNIYSYGAAEQRQEITGPGPFPIPDEDGDDTFSNPFGGIFSTASGIAQGIGLGGLGIAGSLIVLAVGFPLIVLAVLFPIAILILAILAFPVLKLTLPATDPNLARTLKSGIKDVAGRAMEVLQSEECVERISCQIARKARKLPYEDWILEKMSASERPWTARLTKSVKAGRTGENCDDFKCSPMTKVSELFTALKTTRSRQ